MGSWAKSFSAVRSNHTSHIFRVVKGTVKVAIKDEHGNIPRNEKFEKNMRDTVTSVSKLRTLVLLGHYDSFFLQLFQDMFQEANNLRLLQMSARSADFLKCGPDEMNGALPQVLSKLYHLQVLNVGSYTDPTIPDGINNLVSLQNIIVHKGAYSSITTIDSMTPFQKPHGFKVQISSGLEMTQLQSKDEFVQHWMHVKTLEEAYEAGLRNNELSEKLLLPWNETPWDIAMELERQPRQDIHNLQISGYGATMFSTLDNCSIYNCKEWKILPSLGRFPFLAKLILSSLEKVIQVLLPSLEELVLFEMPKLERCTCTSVEGMNSSLRALQIEKCGALKEFDLFKNDGEFEIEQRPWLPGLTKLILRDCPDLEVSRPLPPSTTVYELLIQRVSTLPYMKGSSSEDLLIRFIGRPREDFAESSDESRILDDRILAPHNLRNLKSMTIDGFGNLTCISFKGFSHLVSLKSLEISNCAQLFSLDLMPEHTLEDGSAANGKAFPSLESLSIDSCGVTGKWLCLLLKHAPYLEELNLSQVEEEEDEAEEEQEEEENGQPNRISAWEDSSSRKHGDALTGSAQDRLVHIPPNLISSLKKISIQDCSRLTVNLSEEGFSVFTSLQQLKVVRCPELFSSLVHKDGNDDVANGRCLLPTSLEECVLWGGGDVKTLQPCFPSDLTNLRKLEVGSCTALESLQLQWCTELKELMIWNRGSLTAIERLQSLVSLRKLKVHDSEDLKSLEMHSCTALEELTIEYCESLTTLEGPQSLLKKLEVGSCKALESLQLRSCVALEELIIYRCKSLATIEGLQFHGSLRHLALSYCPGLPPWLESFSRQGCELWPRLETLETDDPSLLTTSFCERRTSLQRLKLQYLVLTEEQGGALVLIKSLQELEFFHCRDLVDLPAGLYLLPSLKRLKVKICRGISRLPERGLPPSLEELELDSCSKEVADQCRALATSKLVVKIV